MGTDPSKIIITELLDPAKSFCAFSALGGFFRAGQLTSIDGKESRGNFSLCSPGLALYPRYVERTTISATTRQSAPNAPISPPHIRPTYILSIPTHNVYVYTYIYIYVPMCSHVYICIYVYMYVYINTYIHSPLDLYLSEHRNTSTATFLPFDRNGIKSVRWNANVVAKLFKGDLENCEVWTWERGDISNRAIDDWVSIDR